MTVAILALDESPVRPATISFMEGALVVASTAVHHPLKVIAVAPVVRQAEALIFFIYIIFSFGTGCLCGRCSSTASCPSRSRSEDSLDLPSGVTVSVRRQ